jgi:DNA-binding GntR family transcriptional regulator
MVIEYPSIKHLDLTEQTYRFLKERILKREISPGEKISVEDIAHGLGVSRTPVVNALKIDVAEMFEIRLLIELYAARQIFQEGKIDLLLKAIEEPLSRMQAAMAEDNYINYESFISGDRDLHMNIVRLLDNQRLIQIYTDLNVHMQVARAHYLDTVENAYQAQREHDAMLHAIHKRDMEGLEAALTEHISTVEDRILTMLAERGGQL